MNSSTVTKTFVFEREDTQQSISCNYELESQSSEVNVEHIFNNHCPPLKNRVFVYDPSSQNFESLGDFGPWNGLLPQRLLEP
jgi:hypothetical protein